jgi:carbon starvation protein
MNILELFLFAIILFVLAYRFYARYLARKMGEKSDRQTPAVDKNDGRDFVPTSVPVLFAHHYATIAGAGPIIGPTMGILYGVGPAWLWIVIGGILFGAVHDFSALFASIREGGQSIAEIARKALGDFGFLLFIAFTGIMLILVTSAFLSLTAVSLTSIWPIDRLGLEAGQTLLKMRLVDDQPMGVIGGIASTSVIIITACAPLLGFLIFKRRINTIISFALAIAVCVISVYVGFQWPVSMSSLTWMIIISVYVFIAAGLPVWTILQPRDFINVQILYFGLIVMTLSVIIAGFGGASTIHMPTFNLAEGQAQMGPVWPILFIIIACGAISGFHALVAGGTTAKQLARESQAKVVGYGAMILESALAVLVILAIASSLKYADYMTITWPAAGTGNPILAYALAVGNLAHRALGIPVAFGAIIGILMVEGFVVTTLDSAVRLNRYIFEELWKRIFKSAPALFSKFWFNSALAVNLMFILAVSNGYKLIWPVFGASNQLLAALSLLAVSAWLRLRGRANWFTLVPAVIMLTTTIAALIYYLVEKYIPAGNIALIVTDIILLILAFGVVFQTCRKSFGGRRQQESSAIST